jgi:hypothetical protein
MLHFTTLTSGLALLLATTSTHAAPHYYVPTGNARDLYQQFAAVGAAQLVASEGVAVDHIDLTDAQSATAWATAPASAEVGPRRALGNNWEVVQPAITPGSKDMDLPRAMGHIPMANPSFAKLVRAEEGKVSMYVTSFTGNPFGKDQVYLYPDASKVFSGPAPTGSESVPTTHYQTVEGSVVWPNEVTPVPPALFGGREGVVVAGGFLVPGKSNGGLWFSER